MVTVRKYAIAQLHARGLNQHSYWTGDTWTSGLRNAVLYASEVDAGKVLETFFHPVRVNVNLVPIMVHLEIPNEEVH